MKEHSRLFCRLLITAFLILLWYSVAPCASSDDSSALLKSLQETADQYWQFKVKREFDKAYQLEDPESIKDVSLTDYIRSIGTGVKWLKASAEDPELKDENSGIVKVRIRYVWTFAKQNPENGFEGIALEKWKLRDGKWYHVYRDPRQGFKGSLENKTDQQPQPQSM